MTKRAKPKSIWGDPQRLAALNTFDILDTESETAFDEITQLASESCGAPVAAVSFFEADRQWFKSQIGLGIDETSLADSICAKATHQSKIVVVNDLAGDERFQDNVFVTSRLRLRFYAAARLETSDGLLLGAVCVGDVVPRPHGLTEAQSSTLLALARAVMRELELRSSNKALAENTALLNGALENVDQGIIMVGPSGDVVVCNQRAIDLLDLPAAMMRSVPKFEDVKRWQIAQGEFAEADPALVKAIRYEGNNIEASVYERRRPNGTVLEVRTNRLPNGGVVRTFADITARKLAEGDRDLAEERLRESEQRYRLAAHATSDAIYDWTFQSDHLQWGGSLEGMFGYGAGQTPATGTKWLESVHPDDRAAIDDEIRHFIAGQAGERWEGEYRWRNGDGDFAFVRDRAHLVRDPSGHPLRMVGALQDLTQARRASEALRTSEERLRLALAATGLGIWDLDFATGHLEWSPEVRRTLGVAETAALEREDFLPLVHPDDRTRIRAAFYPAVDRDAPSVSATFRIIRATDGETRWLEVGGRTLYDAGGRPVRMLGTLQDITPRKIAEDAVRIGGERLRLALQASNMVAWDVDLATKHVDRSDNAYALLGIHSGPTSEFVERVHPDDRHKVDLLRLAAIADGTHSTEVRYRAPDGREIWLAIRAEQKGPERLIGITFDISDRKATEKAIWQTANHDPLTGLANRALFQTRLEDALAAAESGGTGVGLLLLDLDDFKDINDTLGHAAGDELLAETAARLTRLVGDRGTVARVGGDEFAVVLVEQSGLTDIASCAAQIVEALRTTFDYEGRALSTKASIGVAAFPEHHRDPVELMKDADIALYRAKEGGRSRAVVYSSAARDLMERRVSILREVRQGLEASEFLPHYQPKVSLETGVVVGFEALARWRHPALGLLTPAYFGSAFDDQEISTALATSMIGQVASDIRVWLDQGLEFGRVAVNLASADFADRTLATRIVALLDAANVPTSRFEIEVTETVFLGRQTEGAAAVLSEFHEAGISIALDDFGTGFASLTHLKQFPVDHIKIDQSFVRNLETDRDDAAIVAAIVSLGRNMGMKITAEGVENAGQAERLRDAGCDFGQGYFYAKPAFGERVPWMIRNLASPAGRNVPGEGLFGSPARKRQVGRRLPLS
ncbi:MAG TPA: EAL domain-containing protein [Bosea sp. (in: a-proteobacteria)]|uniref:EAL domain-containing protein n=1 Tax=Bosea sp. (in: a-proteobacteria) TaxID=1871050 RepID=UPI002DDD294D|nr:EAL domain-containing protein [Bosea sp. (in: a-proteobacteria)]HEV2553854.1 EAL domain-containing protein [Bosea sp. (in: a-proteobacteria)]